MKVCNKCNLEKDETCFLKRSDNGKLRNQCIECRSKENKKHRSKEGSIQKRIDNSKSVMINNRQQLTSFMKEKCCLLCGESHRACLQFDHRDPKDKNFSISRGMRGTYCWQTILKEIHKCDILCANCHAKRTAIQQGWYNN